MRSFPAVFDQIQHRQFWRVSTRYQVDAKATQHVRIDLARPVR